jgi:hypothetical protein
MSSFNHGFSFTLALVLILFGCSSIHENVVGPDPFPELSTATRTIDSSRYLWGHWNIEVAANRQSATLTPIRQANAHLNAIRMLEDSPCNACLKITGISPSSNGTILVDLELTHPSTNPTLTGFDVRGIAMFSGTHTFTVSGLTMPNRNFGDGELVNPDGYTALYNLTTSGKGPNGIEGYIEGRLASDLPPSALLNGYKRFITDDPENTRNAFIAGSIATATYEIDMPDGVFVFGYAIDANWAVPEVIPVENPISDFPPEANCPEPWQLSVSIQHVGQGINDLGGESELIIDVYDWQGKESHLQPIVECPQLFDGEVFGSFVESNTKYDRYAAVISNKNLAALGLYRCLVSIEDVEQFTTPPWLDLTAYQVFHADVIEHQNIPPTASAGFGPDPQKICDPVYFFNQGSEDPDGTISTYQWDWDNDGVWDESGESASHEWDAPGVYKVQFSVTDNAGDSDSLDEPLNIIVNNVLPTATANVNKLEVMENNPLNFDGSESHDNDCVGEIVSYEWDWNNDGDFEDSGVQVSHAWPFEGLYEVQLRVTDDEGGSDLLNTPIEIHVVHNQGWAGTWGSNVNEDKAWCVATDPLGNFYVAGHISGDTDFDPGNGGEYFDEENGRTYVSKFNADGEFEWVSQFGGLAWLQPWDITADGQGNCYIVTSDGQIKKFDTNGNPGWTQSWDIGHTWSAGPEQYVTNFMGIECTNEGDVYVCGFSKNDLPWDGGIEVDGSDAFLAKFDTNGVNQWAAAWGGTSLGSLPFENPAEFASDLAIDTEGNIVVTGSFGGVCDFDPSPESYLIEGTQDVFVTKFTPDGDHLWAVKWGEMGSNTDYYSFGVATDSANDIYLAGQYYLDACLVKFSSVGEYQWLRFWGYSVLTKQWAFDVAVDSLDYVYVTGQTDSYAIGYQPLDFDPDPVDADWITPLGRFNSYLCKYDTDGDYKWCRLWGSDDTFDSVSPPTDFGHDLAVDPFDSIFVAGNLLGCADFNPDPNGEEWHCTQDFTQDAYVVKFLSNGFWE